MSRYAFTSGVVRLTGQGADRYRAGRLAAIARAGYDDWTPFGRARLIVYPVDAHDEAGCRALVRAVFTGEHPRGRADT